MLRARAIVLMLLNMCTICARAEERADDRSTAIKTAKTLYQNKKFQDTVDVLRSLLESKPRDEEAEQIAALAYYSLGQFERAIPLLEDLRLKAGPVGFDTSYLLGMCHLKEGHPDKARAAFAQMYSVPENGAAAYLFLSRILVREHREQVAVPELQKAISLDNRLGMAHFLLGEIYLHQGTVEPAIAEFRKELAISPGLWLVYWRLADALVRAGAYDDAERAAKQAIWLNESFSGSYVTLGEIALKRGDFELAEGLLERAVKMEPGNQNAHYGLARAYQKLGRADDAKKQFELSRSLLTDKSATDSSGLQ